MRKIHFIILGFMVVSCGSGEEETKTNSDDSSSVAIVPVDTVVNPEIMYTDIDLDRLFAKAGSKDGNLFIIDSAYIANHAKADESSKLTGSEAKLLMSSIVEETAEWKVDEIADFIFFIHVTVTISLVLINYTIIDSCSNQRFSPYRGICTSA